MFYREVVGIECQSVVFVKTKLIFTPESVLVFGRYYCVVVSNDNSVPEYGIAEYKVLLEGCKFIFNIFQTSVWQILQITLQCRSIAAHFTEVAVHALRCAESIARRDFSFEIFNDLVEFCLRHPPDIADSAQSSVYCNGFLYFLQQPQRSESVLRREMPEVVVKQD